MEKYEEFTNDWNYDVSYMLKPLLFWDLINFKQLTFVAQSVHTALHSPKSKLKFLNEFSINFCLFCLRYLIKQ